MIILKNKKPLVDWLCTKSCKVIRSTIINGNIAVHLYLSLQIFALTQDNLYQVFAFRDIWSLNCVRWAQGSVLLHFYCCGFFFYKQLLQNCFTSLRQGMGILYCQNIGMYVCMYVCTRFGYKITGLMLEHFVFKKLHNGNVVTLNVLPSPIPTPLHANLPLLEAMLQVIFWQLIHELRRFCLHCIYGLEPGSF